MRDGELPLRCSLTRPLILITLSSWGGGGGGESLQFGFLGAQLPKSKIRRDDG